MPANGYHLPSISRLFVSTLHLPRNPCVLGQLNTYFNHEHEVSGPRAGATHLVATEQLGSRLALRDPEPTHHPHARSRCRGSREPLLDMELSQHWGAEPPTMSGTTTRPLRSPYQGPEGGWQNTPETEFESFPLPVLLSPVTQESVSTDEQHLSSTVYNNLAESLAHAPSRKHWRDQVGPGESSQV